MSRIKAPEKASEEMKKEWEPAPVDVMIKFINKFPPVDEINNGHAFCRMIRNRCKEKWPKEILDYIKKFAEFHPDPGAEVECKSVIELQHAAINHTRGLAAAAIGALLFHHEDLFDFFEQIIVKLVSDPHPAVRTAALSIILPLWNIDEKKLWIIMK